MKGRVKEDSAFKFYEQESSWKATIHNLSRKHDRLSRTTHDPSRTKHGARPLSNPPTHPPTHPRQLVNANLYLIYQCIFELQ